MGTKHFEVEHTLTDVDAETGEVKKIVRQERHITRAVESEPPFIKVYIDDIARLNKIQAKSVKVLFELLAIMDYRNEIQVSVSKKKDICVKLGIWNRKQNGKKELGVNVVDQHIHRLVKGGLLSRKERGLYVANPAYFGKGKWGDIRKIRLSIEYTKDGRFIVGQIDKEN